MFLVSQDKQIIHFGDNFYFQRKHFPLWFGGETQQQMFNYCWFVFLYTINSLFPGTILYLILSLNADMTRGVKLLEAARFINLRFITAQLY